MERYHNRPWMEALRGKPLSEGWLARQLRPYGIRPTTMRLGERVGRGYVSKDFEEALRRYVPATEARAMLREAYVPPPPTGELQERGSEMLKADGGARDGDKDD